jgi:hypothetical protein
MYSCVALGCGKGVGVKAGRMVGVNVRVASAIGVTGAIEEQPFRIKTSSSNIFLLISYLLRLFLAMRGWGNLVFLPIVLLEKSFKKKEVITITGFSGSAIDIISYTGGPIVVRRSTRGRKIHLVRNLGFIP